MSETTRWAILHHGVHIIEVSLALTSSLKANYQLATIIDLKTRDLGQNNKSKSKDQKALMQDLKDARSTLKSQVKPLIGKLNGLVMDDREIDWAGVNGGLIDVSCLSNRWG